MASEVIIKGDRPTGIVEYVVETKFGSDSHPYWIEVRIDHDKRTKTSCGQTEKDTQGWMFEMVSFWHDWEADIEGELTYDSVIQLCLKNIAKRALQLSVSNDYTLKGIIRAFDHEEGFIPMDGTWGIEIIYESGFYFDAIEWEIKRKEAING